jgi:hypothetical protein
VRRRGISCSPKRTSSGTLDDRVVCAIVATRDTVEPSFSATQFDECPSVERRTSATRPCTELTIDTNHTVQCCCHSQCHHPHTTTTHCAPTPWHFDRDSTEETFDVDDGQALGWE